MTTSLAVRQLLTAASTVVFSSVIFPPLTLWFSVMTVLDWAVNVIFNSIRLLRWVLVFHYDFEIRCIVITTFKVEP